MWKYISSILLLSVFCIREIYTEKIGYERKFYIDYEKNTFIMDDKPFRFIAGSMHYFRVESAHWRDRLEKLKAAGLNTVDTYVEWSLHNPHDGGYLWDEDANLEEFLHIADEVGLYVILRPGPYISADRDFGGQPYWLLYKYHDRIGADKLGLRTNDFDYISEAKTWLQELFDNINIHLYGNGGPIILVQVESEYGSFNCDQHYRDSIYSIYEELVQDKAVLFTSDNYEGNVTCGKMGQAYSTVYFGPGDNIEKAWSVHRQASPKGPLVNSKYNIGELIHWGEKPKDVSTEKVTATLRKILEQDANVVLYMFAGGTNFEYTNGASFFNETYLPQITSYYYDAPISESGDLTPKYQAIKQVISEFAEIPNILVENTSKGKYGTIQVKPGFALLDERHDLRSYYLDCAAPVKFEKMDQKDGFIIYERFLEEDREGLFSAPHIRDRALVYINEVYVGTLDRRLNKVYLNINARKGSKLTLILEHQGRISSGTIAAEYKGLNHEVSWGGSNLVLWNNTGIPLTFPPHFINYELGVGDRAKTGQLKNGPIIYEGNFSFTGIPKDTFLDMTNWGKGIVWINGRNLGRYWPSLGPQMTLFVPKFYLYPGINSIDILELEFANPFLNVTFTDTHKVSQNSNSLAKLFMTCLLIGFVMNIVL